MGLFSDERKTYNVKVIGRDPLTDSALIKLENGPGKLPTADLGNSDALEPGDWVVAIGNRSTLSRRSCPNCGRDGFTAHVSAFKYKRRR